MFYHSYSLGMRGLTSHIVPDECKAVVKDVQKFVKTT